VPLGSWDLLPTVGMRAAWYCLNDWSESGADSLSLTAPAQTVKSVQADAGARIGRATGTLRPFGSGWYRRELTDGRTAATVQFVDRSTGTFEIRGPDLVSDAVGGQAGLTVIRPRFALSVYYEVRQSRPQTRQSLHLGFGF
jgi:uncharacterized protein YhjY with autotransporter beta-barrel domain